jgi:hypothetical protein
MIAHWEQRSSAARLDALDEREDVRLVAFDKASNSRKVLAVPTLSPVRAPSDEPARAFEPSKATNRRQSVIL